MRMGTRTRRRARLRQALRAFLVGDAGAAGLELALGSVTFLAAAVLFLEVYSITRAHAHTLHLAVAMTDYVARQAAPETDELQALADVMRARTLGSGARAHYVVSAVRRESNDDTTDPRVLWTTRLPSGPGTTAEHDALRTHCSGHGAQGARTTFTDLSIVVGETVIIVEVCTRLGALDLDGDGITSISGGWLSPARRHHVLPIRDQATIPPEPT